jgi:hypothetical protein
MAPFDDRVPAGPRQDIGGIAATLEIARADGRADADNSRAPATRLAQWTSGAMDVWRNGLGRAESTAEREA